MPIKLPKGFPRRKSSGNALEEVHNPPQPPQPSFRVFERPRSGSKSFDGGHQLKRMTQGRPLSEGRSFEDGRPSPAANLANRGSGGTQNSASSGGLYDTSSSSARFSSSSTLPSSSSIENYTDDSLHAHPTPAKPLPHLPLPVAKPGFLQRASERSFSMGRKAAHAGPAAEAVQVPHAPRNAVYTPQPRNAYYQDLPDLGHVTRSRGMTETSGSTATPPKLLDTDLDFGRSSESDFGNMFEGFDGDRKRISRSPEHLSPADTRNGLSQPASGLSPHPYVNNRSPFTPPPPLNVDRSRQVPASPFSNDSRTSMDGLMAPSPQEDREGFEKSEPVYQQRSVPFRNTPSPGSPVISSPTTESRQQLLGSSLRRDSTYGGRRKSTPIEDTDAMIVNGSASSNRREDAPPKTYQKGQPSVSRKPVSKRQAPGPRIDSLASSNQTTPKPQPPEVSLNDNSLLDDQSFRDMAKSAERFQSGEGSPKSSKVMTPAQFEKYRKQQELLRSRSNASKTDDSDDGDRYSDDDEERQNELVRQRRKQEAHLAVYRQQMMKVTGEQPSKVDPRPGMERHNLSTPNLTTRKSSQSLAAAAANGKDSDNEDEDIPLGILAAHGFPSKDRRPTEHGRPVSNIQYTSESYPPPPAVVAGSVAGGGSRGTLPPFARNLPKDPYYGASIVNPTNRESLMFGAGAGSVYGGSQAPSTHPGGLVGVIATEERARAMRRGSPHAQGGYPDTQRGYGLPGTGLPLPPSMSPPGIPSSGMLSAGDQAQIQMSQQMNQMMQMQMQWMQQMQQMVAVQGLQPGQVLPQMLPMPQTSMMQSGFMSPPGGGLQVPQIQMQRPMSMGGQPPSFGQPWPQQQQRARSMLNPDMAFHWQGPGTRSSVAPSIMMSGALGPGPGYTPSIAPSERSNVGQPSRYRPVSTVLADEAPRSKSRASTTSGATVLKGWDTNGNRKSSGMLEVPRQSVRAVKKESDDDDEEGWEEMKRKKEQKKRLKGTKSTDQLGPLGNIFYPGT